MRIAFITPEYPQCGPSFGIGRYVEWLARNLEDHGHAVVVAVICEHGWWLGHGHRVHQVNAYPIPGFLRPLLASRWLHRILDDLAPDVIEVSNWGGLAAHVHGPWPIVTRLSTSIADIAPTTAIARRTWRWHQKLEIASVHRSAVVIANSQTIADRCALLYRRRADHIIPHAIAIPEQQPTPSGRDILFIGRLEHRKGVDILLRAWQQVRAKHPDRLLHIVGIDRHNFATHLSAAVTQQVRFLGHVSDHHLAALRDSCAIQVIPSRFESFGLTALEAFAAGQAVIAANCGGLQETIGDAGLAYDVESPQALANVLDNLCRDPALLETLRQRGWDRLQHRYTIDVWRERTLAAYEDARQRARFNFRY